MIDVLTPSHRALCQLSFCFRLHAVILLLRLHQAHTLTSLLDAELHGRACGPHRADRLALILALVVGCHPRNA